MVVKKKGHTAGGSTDAGVDIRSRSNDIIPMQTNNIQHTHERPHGAAMTGTEVHANLLANFKSMDAPT
eukprot:5302255-Ditylum_brightwellii.AAC.1